MVLQISKTKNVGSFQHFLWNDINPPQIPNRNGQLVNNVTDFKKYNILYGENGTGKSTIVNVFKSLHANDQDLEKNWDRENEDRVAILRTDNQTDITFSEGTGWQNNTLAGSFIFFDRNFINSHVHSFPLARESGHDKNTGKLVLLLGDFALYKDQLDKLVALQDSLTKKNEALKKSNDDKKYKLLGNRSENDVRSTFEKTEALRDDERPSDDDLRNKISTDKENLNKVEKIISEAEAIKNLHLLEKLNKYERVDIEKIKQAFQFSVASGTATVLEKIKGRESFIQTGLKQLKEKASDKCPFCEQDIKTNEEYLHIVKEYELIFDEEFNKTQTEAVRVLQEYRKHLLMLMQGINTDTNQERLRTANRLLSSDTTLPNVTLDKDKIELINKEIESVDQKLQDFLTKFELSNPNAIADIDNELNTKIEAYNHSVGTVNGDITKTQNELGGEVEKQRDLLLETIEKSELKLFISEQFSNLKDIYAIETKYEANKQKIASLKTIVDKVIEKVKVKFREFVDTYFKEIEKYVKIFCPSIQVSIVSPRVTYDLRSDDVVCGFEVRYKEKDRFSNLSDGEKQSVALAYFLALLNQSKDKDKKIVVFDDPINSFDAGRRKMCAEYILKEVIAFKQSFVFTCDPLFRTYIRKAIGRKFGNERSDYYVLKSASSAIHYRTDNQATIYAVFKTEFQNIDSVLGTDENIIVYGQKLRYCIEEVKDKYLGYGHDSLDNILTQVQQSNFEKFKNSIDDLMEIYTYCNTGGLAHYPRDGKTSWDELKTYTKRYIGLGI